MLPRRLAALALAVIALVVRPGTTAAPPGRIDFARDVQPILAARCLSCHGADKQKGDLRLDRADSPLRGGSIVPGRSDASPLIQRVRGVGEGKAMPPGGSRLSEQQVALLRAWIDQGATWPSLATAAQATHRAYRPLVRPPLPTLRRPEQAHNPIDTFVQARLEAAGLSPAPPADRRTLIRRLSFDLLGLPPTPEEIDAFVADPRPDAYERVVDRLLASPAYGERRARHWLDVVHYAETHGHDQDVPRENAWPYRDYLIRAFNSDRPYGRFVEEQVAGDVLYPDDPDGVVATGMLAAGPWDESSQQSIRDDTLDKKQAQNLDRDDIVTTVLSAFSSTTVHCARCHDHKFDPVSQQEYYGLQAVFAGIDRANRPYDPDPPVHRQRRALTRRLRELRDAGATVLLTPEHARSVAVWEERQRRGGTWQTLSLDTMTMAHGSVPARQGDGSVRFGGPRPEREIATLTAATPLTVVTAIRLEVLTDDALPHRGPGRQDNGNLHLNEFRVASAAADGSWKPAAVRLARADFDQVGWTAAHAIDGNPATAWGIYPAVGQPHQVVFVLTRPLESAGGVRLRLTLEQTHGGGHLIGRLRLSASAAASPEGTAALPAEVAAALATPAARRSEAQRAALTRHVLISRAEAERAALPAPRQVYAAAADFQPVGSFRPAKGPRPVEVLRRGEITRPAGTAVPQALNCLPGLTGALPIAPGADEGARRAALARWLADERNVLTWRSIANRVWHYHFGKGIVDTPGDLGKMGGEPSHPELLDWLAVELRDSGGSLKRLHRRIVTSAAYRRAARHDEAAARRDADNRLLWRGQRQRLDAESVRDAVLAASGTLDRHMGGPSDRQFRQAPGLHVTPNADYLTFDLDTAQARRRSVYRFVFRTLPDPFLAALDCPDASQFTPARSASITPLQALALLNDRLMVWQAQRLAERVRGEAGTEPARQIDRLYRLTLGRHATEMELRLLAGYATRHGLAGACRLLLNSNEFHFVD